MTAATDAPCRSQSRPGALKPIKGVGGFFAMTLDALDDDSAFTVHLALEFFIQAWFRDAGIELFRPSCSPSVYPPRTNFMLNLLLQSIGHSRPVGHSARRSPWSLAWARSSRRFVERGARPPPCALTWVPHHPRKTEPRYARRWASGPESNRWSRLPWGKCSPPQWQPRFYHQRSYSTTGLIGLLRLHLHFQNITPAAHGLAAASL